MAGEGAADDGEVGALTCRQTSRTLSQEQQPLRGTGRRIEPHIDPAAVWTSDLAEFGFGVGRAGEGERQQAGEKDFH